MASGQSAKLAELATIRMGYPFRSRIEPVRDGDLAVIQMRDIDENRVRLEDALRIVLPDGWADHALHAGDLLFRSRGQSNGAALVPEGLGMAVASAPLVRIRPRRVLPEYLAWFLNSPAAQAQLASVAEGTSVRMISTGSLGAVEIPLPPESVQHRIAEAAVLVDQEQTLMALIASRRLRLSTHLLLQRARQTSDPEKGER